MNNETAIHPPRSSGRSKPRLMDQLRGELRVRHYAYKTEKSYVHWVKRFVLLNGTRHPRELGAAEVKAFLSHLAVNRNVSASTQNQALCALVFVFLYRHVLEIDLGDCSGFSFATRPKRLPTVLTTEEVEQILLTSGDWRS